MKQLFFVILCLFNLTQLLYIYYYICIKKKDIYLSQDRQIKNKNQKIKYLNNNIIKKLADLKQAQQLENSLKEEINSLSNFNDFLKINKKEKQQQLNTINNSILDKTDNLKILQKQQSEVKEQITQLKRAIQIANLARIKQQEQKDRWKFYSIHLTDSQISDIKKMQQWKKELRDPSIVGKVIWSTYIIKPTGDLCNRVFGIDKKCGIYKITNKQTGQIYIGQSVNIQDRIKQHIKCGLGIDAPATNKLYNKMQDSNLQYWTFELLEECSKEKLNEKERFWIDFYGTDKLGLNVQKGNRG